MAENLNYNANGSKCYDNQESNCQKYGRLYNWNVAKTVCPSGWHLPSNAEWQVLLASVGGDKTAGKFLKATSGWTGNTHGDDKFGFSALPGGFSDSTGTFYNVGNFGNWWSTTEDSASNACFRGMYSSNDEVGYYKYSKNILFSVRCLKD